MLMGGQSDELRKNVETILDLDANDLTAIRMLVRYCSWKRDAEALQRSLEKMAKIARTADSVEDERYALSQLTVIVPHNVEFSERLQEINKKHGFVDTVFDEKILQEHLAHAEVADFDQVVTPVAVESSGFDFVQNANGAATEIVGAELYDETVASLNGNGVIHEEEILAPKYETDLDKELESLRFYIDNEYFELAGRTLAEMRERFGEKAEFAEIDARLNTAVAHQTNGSKPLNIAEIRNEFGIEELDPIDDSDYDTHYQMGIAYQEMGLLEQAISEYQDAISLVRPNDGTRRFFQCANLLGHCFMQNNMANLALTWYQRALETPELVGDEKQGVWYEIAHAYETDGDVESAGRYFEQVYAENVDYRDVGERIRRLTVQAA
jgi:tetratricopeptide (TPR) repeat protein